MVTCTSCGILAQFIFNFTDFSHWYSLITINYDYHPCAKFLSFHEHCVHIVSSVRNCWQTFLSVCCILHWMKRAYLQVPVGKLWNLRNLRWMDFLGIIRMVLHWKITSQHKKKNGKLLGTLKSYLTLYDNHYVSREIPITTSD